VRLVFDSNLFHKLVKRLGQTFPDLEHVRNTLGARASDMEIWDFARVKGYTIVSKDNDFLDLSLVLGHPPKVVFIRTGNCSTEAIANLLERNQQTIDEFMSNNLRSLLVLD
jgi:predicted nuclease of predicted toxin-antitoxin system